MHIQRSQPPLRPAPARPGILATLGESVADLSNVTGVLPKFIYPTVTGTPAQQALVWQALDRLPMHQAVRPISIEVVPSLSEGPKLLGLNRSTAGAISINAGGYGMSSPADFQDTVIHEVGHSVDYRAGSFSVFTGQHPSATVDCYGKGPFVSNYAKSDPAEDFAETYALHHQRPETLQSVNAAKAAHQAQLDQPAWLERMVDRPAFRETGRFIGQQFEGAPVVRTGLEVLRQAIVVTQTVLGVGEAVEGIVKGKPGQAVAGLLATGAGVGLAMAPALPWMGLAATAALGANRGLQLAAQGGASPARQSAATLAGAAGGALGGFAAPLALVEVGHSLAGPIGGCMGLVVGGLLGSYCGSRWAAQAALALTTP